MSQELVHITVGYPRTPFMDLLRDSSVWHGCRFVGLPKHWGTAAFSMFAKETMVKAYLEMGDVDLDAVILFTDAYDVLITESAGTILEKFYAIGADLVFAAEPNFWPRTPDGRDAAKARFDTEESKWRYVNGGGWIGYGWAVKQMVDSLCAWIASKDYDASWHNNDQPFLQEFYLNNRSSTTCRVALDTGPDIFCCLISDIDEFAVHHSRVRRRESGKSISVLHANGDKRNLAILPRYWALSGGATGAARLHDLRVATVRDQVLGYDADHHKLVASDARDPALPVFLVKGDRHAIGLSATHGLLTFTPGTTVVTGATRIDIWEELFTHDGITGTHGVPLAQYCAVANADEVTLAPLPLKCLLEPAFDELLALLTRYESRL